MNTALHHHRRHWAIPIALVASMSLALAGPATAAEPSRPFGGFTAPAVETFGPPIGCAPTDGLVQHYTATARGVFTHLGLVDITVTHCAFVDPTTGAGVIADGAITMVAANGDTLLVADHGTFQLSPWPNPTMSDPHLVWVVVGGTGRFADATGSGEAWVVSDLVAGITTSTWAGTIAY